MAGPTRTAAAGTYQSSSGEDFIHFTDKSGNVVGWIDSNGFGRGLLSSVPLFGLLADIPLDLLPGVLYFATDVNQLYVSDGPGNSRVVALPLSGSVADIPILGLAQLYFATDTNELYIGSLSGNRLISSGSGFPSTIDCGNF